MTTRIKLRRDTAANWLLSNPILAAGEPGLETDTGKTKYGDGVTAYNLLPHAGGDLLVNDTAVTVTAGDDTKWIALSKRDNRYSGQNEQGIRNLSVTYDNAGNIITVGTIGQLSQNNIYICKYTPAGVCLWKKSLVEVGNDYFTAYVEGGLVVDSNNNIIMAWSNNSTGVNLLKLDTDGESVWCEVYDDGDINLVVASIAVDSHDDIFITTGNESPGSVIGLAKIARATGAVVWSKQMTDTGTWQWGTSVAVDYLDNILVSGFVTGEFGPSGSSLSVVVKLDSEANVLWRKTLSLPDSAVDLNSSYPSGIDTDALGNVYITGSYSVQSPNTSEDYASSQISSAVYIVKLNTSGTVQWSRRAGPGPCDWTGLSTTIGDDGDLYLAAATRTRTNEFLGGAATENANMEKGFYESNLVLARYSPGTGDVVWQKYFNNRHEQVSSNWYTASTRSIDVHEDKLVICGSSQISFDYGNGTDSNNWVTGWVAQLSTDSAVGFDLADFKFVDSRVPGRKITVSANANSTLEIANGSLTQVDSNDGIPTTDAPVSITLVKSKSNTWTFDSQGTIHAPVEGNIVLDQTELGYINFMGYENNQNDDIWFQSVVGDIDGNTYALGCDDWSGPRQPAVYKFDPHGKIVWGVQLKSGSGSVWDISWTTGTYTIGVLTNAGINYRVGDTVVIGGDNFANGNSPTNNLTIEVTEVDNGNSGGSGAITGYEIQSGVAPTIDGSGTGYEDYNDQGEGRPHGITIDPATGNLHVVCTTYEYSGNDSILYLVLDGESGACLSNKEIHNPGIEIYPYDVQVSSAGVPAIVGQEYGLTDIVLGELTALAGSPAGFVRIGKEVISTNADGRYPGISGGSDWYVTGTGISGRAYIAEYNFYENMSTTVTQGDGLATFTVTSDGSGYGGYPTIVSSGTNYIVGHKLKIIGSLLGGVDSTNDAILQVLEVGSGGAIANAQIISGTADAASTGTYTAVASANYQVGSGAIVNIYFNAVDGSVNYAYATNSGNFYTVGDKLTVSGASFAGSTSPTNDIQFLVAAANGSYAQGQVGPINDISVVGGQTISTEYLSLKIDTAGSIDFTGTGSWQLLESRNGEGVIWTPEFQKAFGNTGNDWFNSVAWQGTGTVYAAGASHNVVGNFDENIIVKMSSTGTVAWTKQVTHADYQGYSEIYSIGTHADGVVAVGKVNDWNEEAYVGFLAKLDNDGALVWHKHIYFNNGSPNELTMAIDPATGDILVAASGYDNDLDDDIIRLVKFDRDGNAVWKRRLYSRWGEYFNWNSGNRALHIAGDKFFFAGHTYYGIDNYANAFSTSLPLDGTGTGQYGIWTYDADTDNNLKTYDKPSANAEGHVIESQTVTNIVLNNARFYYMDYPDWTFPVVTEVVRNKIGGAIVFPDGTRQTTSAAVSQQVRIGQEYQITIDDANGHIFIDDDGTNQSRYVRIPYWEYVKLPVGFKFSIINRSGSTVYVEMDSGFNNEGSIYGINGNGNYNAWPQWYMNGNTNGANWIELIKVKEGFTVSDNNRGAEWVIRGVPDNFWAND